MASEGQKGDIPLVIASIRRKSEIVDGTPESAVSAGACIRPCERLIRGRPSCRAPGPTSLASGRCPQGRPFRMCPECRADAGVMRNPPFRVGQGGAPADPFPAGARMSGGSDGPAGPLPLARLRSLVRREDRGVLGPVPPPDKPAWGPPACDILTSAPDPKILGRIEAWI